MKKAIIIGASSGIGRAHAFELSRAGYALGLAARRVELLESLEAELPNDSCIMEMDVSDPEDAAEGIDALIAGLGGLDLVVICAGVGFINHELSWELERQTIDVNARGFAAAACRAFNYFAKHGHGHIVGISSVAAYAGCGDGPAYGASKAFMSNYLAGLRRMAKERKVKVHITDIKPGFVDTPMALSPVKFWVASPETAAKQIASAIRRRKKHAYVTRRWRLIAWLLKLMPS